MLKQSIQFPVLSYVAGRRKAFDSFHNGIPPSYNGYEYFQIVRGKFDHHPEIRDLTFHGDKNHQITKGIEEITVFDEPHIF